MQPGTPHSNKENQTTPPNPTENINIEAENEFAKEIGVEYADLLALTKKQEAFLKSIFKMGIENGIKHEVIENTKLTGTYMEIKNSDIFKRVVEEFTPIEIQLLAYDNIRKSFNLLTEAINRRSMMSQKVSELEKLLKNLGKDVNKTIKVDDADENKRLNDAFLKHILDAVDDLHKL